jgi:hypothetical protein
MTLDDAMVLNKMHFHVRIVGFVIFVLAQERRSLDVGILPIAGQQFTICKKLDFIVTQNSVNIQIAIGKFNTE